MRIVVANARACVCVCVPLVRKTTHLNAEGRSVDKVRTHASSSSGRFDNSHTERLGADLDLGLQASHMHASRTSTTLEGEGGHRARPKPAC